MVIKKNIENIIKYHFSCPDMVTFICLGYFCCPLLFVSFLISDNYFDVFILGRSYHIYYFDRLDERKRRKDFILERNLLYSDPFEKSLLPEEKEIYRRFKVFTRFHSREEHERLLRSIIEEHQIMKRIEDLKVRIILLSILDLMIFVCFSFLRLLLDISFALI